VKIEGGKKEEEEAGKMEVEIEEVKKEEVENKDLNNLHKPEAAEEIPKLQITYSDSDPSEPDEDSPYEPQIISVNFVVERLSRSDGSEVRVRDDWFKLLKAAAIFPYECDPPDYSRLMIRFQFKHIHIQLAHASRLGLWEAHNYVRQLGRYYGLDFDHPIRRNYREVDPVLESEITEYRRYEIYSGKFKEAPVHFESSNDEKENYANVENMDDKERNDYMRELYLIETDKSRD